MADPARKLDDHANENSTVHRPGQVFKPELIQGGGQDDSGPKGNLAETTQPVYDNPGTSPSEPVKEKLRALEGGSQTDEPKRGHLSEADGNQPSRDELSEAEKSAAPQHKTAPKHENQLGKGYLSKGKQKGRFRFSRKQKLIGGSAGVGIVGLILAGFISFLPLELIHIKNVFYKEIGGVQSRTYQLGRQQYYSRMFFFDEKGDFSGYKKTTIRGMMYQNRQTNKLVEGLAKNGYRPEFEKVNGVETGKLKALHRIDRQGKIIPGQSITNNGDLTRAWDVKKSGVMPGILRNVFPDETARWHGKMARKLFYRWGLTKTNWIGDYLKQKSGVAALERKELVLRKALRQHLFGSGNSILKNTIPVTDEQKNSTDEATKDFAEQTGAANDLADEIGDKAPKVKQDLLSDGALDPNEPTYNSLNDGANAGLSAQEIAGRTARNVPRSLLKSLNLFGSVSTACVGKNALDSVVTGARVLRAAQLMKFGMSVLNIADAMQNGKAVSLRDVDIMMTYLNSKDAQGHTMFASSGWRYWSTNNSDKNSFSFSNFDKEERNKYSVGGGFTGTLASVDRTINDKLKGRVGCKAANNVFVQAGGFIVGIGAGIFSGGTFTVVNTAVIITIDVAVQTAVGIAAEMLTPIVAGTVVNGAEKGTAVGNSLVSGFEVLSNANGANAGMRPLTTEEYTVALRETKDYQKTQLAKMSLRDKLFSTENENSLTMVASTNLSGFTMSSLLNNPLSLITGALGSLSTWGDKIHAAPASSDCTDEDIAKYNLAATPFCNIQVGIPESLINDPAYYPDAVDQKMMDGGYVDEEGLPVEGKGYDAYLKQCTSDTDSRPGTEYRSIDIIHKSDTEPTDECIKNPLFTMYRFYSYIGQTENDGLTGNNISNNPLPGGSGIATEAGSTVSGNSKEIATQILAAAKAGKIKFNTLNGSDTLDKSTPEDNIAQVANGQLANTTRSCGSGSRGGALAPTTSVALDIDLLKFILEVSQGQNIQINALAGQCHGKPTSSHYSGKAVDFGCPFNTGPADTIGAKYNISYFKDETCSNGANHFHYSIGGS